MAGGALNSHTSRGEFVYQKLHEGIRNGVYSPGDRIRETEVAKRLNVSRTPVREAIRRLQTDGLLVFAAWRGVIVANLDHDQIIELYAMRQVLEGAAARLAAQHAAPSELSAMRDLVAASAKTPEDDTERLAALNREFHQTLYQAAHNRYLLKSLNALRDSLALLRSTTYAVPGRARQAQKEHEAMLQAIRDRNPGAAEQTARDHITQAERARLRLLNAPGLEKDQTR